MSPGGSQRIIFFDNVELALIFTVVLGHVLALSSSESKTAEALINYIYLFHMSVFMFLSGYFSKRVHTQEKGAGANRIISFVVPYILIYTDFWVIGQITDKGRGVNVFFTNSLAWYMLAMA